MSFLTTSSISDKLVYHNTGKAAAVSIFKSKQMIPGPSGAVGGGIYTAETKEAARHKAVHDGVGDDAIVTLKVNMGRTLMIEGNFNRQKPSALMQQHSCDSVMWRSSSSADWEYVLYDPKRVTVLDIDTGRYVSALSRDQSQSTLTSCTYVSNPCEAITGIGGFYSKKDGKVYGKSWPGWTRETTDLRDGLGGFFIYLFSEKREGGHPVTEIGVSYNDDALPNGAIKAKWLDPENCDGTYYVDLRRGAKGSYIYLWYRVDSNITV